MIAFPPNIPMTPLTMAKLSQQPHTPTVLQRILQIRITYKLKSGDVTFNHAVAQ